VLWPGVTLVVVSGLLSFGLKWRTALSALRSIGGMTRGASRGGMAEVEVPSRWFLWGMLVCTALIVFFGWNFFGIAPWMGLLAVALSVLLSIVACRATGETSVTPTGPLGKIAQFMFGGIAQGSIQTNLMASSITAGAAMHSADLLTDLKGGYMLGSRPKYQFIAQFFGLVAGAIFCIPVYKMVATPARLGTVDCPAPAAMTWKAVAELLKNGVGQQVRGQTEMNPFEVPALPVESVPPGLDEYDTFHITSGPNAGEYQLLAVQDKMLILNRMPPDRNSKEPVSVEFIGRPTVKTTGAPKVLFGALFSKLVQGSSRGDFLKLVSDDKRDYWWSVKSVYGGVAIVDHEMPRNTRVEVRKESLPPHATTAILIAAIVAVLLTLVETYAPKHIRGYVPSTTGLGLGFVISGFDSISMLIGATAAWVLSRRNPKFAEDYTLTVGSGVMAGASITGIIFIVVEYVFH
jgi:hypothetical protein